MYIRTETEATVTLGLKFVICKQTNKQPENSFYGYQQTSDKLAKTKRKQQQFFKHDTTGLFIFSLIFGNCNNFYNKFVIEHSVVKFCL